MIADETCRRRTLGTAAGRFVRAGGLEVPGQGGSAAPATPALAIHSLGIQRVTRLIHPLPGVRAGFGARVMLAVSSTLWSGRQWPPGQAMRFRGMRGFAAIPLTTLYNAGALCVAGRRAPLPGTHMAPQPRGTEWPDASAEQHRVTVPLPDLAPPTNRAPFLARMPRRHSLARWTRARA